MKLHILGICGTFMGGVAALARELGHAVDGSDQNVYPPMSTQLQQLGITLASGYAPGHLSADTDVVVVGNALSRGNPAVEHVHDPGLSYTSGAQWLSENVLPGRGRLIVNGEDAAIHEVLAMGAWTPVETFGIDGDHDWIARLRREDGSEFDVLRRGEPVGTVRWHLVGRHNVMNGLAAIAAADAVGADIATAIAALPAFVSVKRRLERLGERDGITVYDDFAHHPTAIRTTLQGLRARVGDARIVVAMEPRSNSMRLGAHAAQIAPSLRDADAVFFLHRPELPWDAAAVVSALQGEGHTVPTVDALVAALAGTVRRGDQVVFMSNGGFEDAPRRLLAALPG